MKMADIDTDPFGEHDKTDEHPDEGEIIPFTTEESHLEDPLGNHDAKKKHSSEEEKPIQPDLKVYVEGLYQKVSETTGQTPSISFTAH